MLVDLIAAGSTVQWFSEPRRLISQAARRLKPHGKLLFNTFLPENLTEIRQITGVGLHYPSQEEWLASDFELLVLDNQPI